MTRRQRQWSWFWFVVIVVGGLLVTMVSGCAEETDDVVIEHATGKMITAADLAYTDDAIYTAPDECDRAAFIVYVGDRRYFCMTVQEAMSAVGFVLDCDVSGAQRCYGHTLRIEITDGLRGLVCDGGR